MREVNQLAPLLAGAGRVIFNGDSVELRFIEEREKGTADFTQLRDLCAEAAVEATFITGNHDPTISELDHVELGSGSIFITHGDVLFHGSSPWSREAERLCRAHTQELEALGNPSDLALRLRAAKRAERAIEHMGPRHRFGGGPPTLRSFLNEIWPPWRPLRILSCWAATPGLAHALAAEHRPQARLVIIGHTHFSGLWRRGSRVIINTGAFLPFSRPLAVDISEASDQTSTVVVRKVDSAKGQFRLGREIARLEVMAPRA